MKYLPLALLALSLNAHSSSQIGCLEFIDLVLERNEMTPKGDKLGLAQVDGERFRKYETKLDGSEEATGYIVEPTDKHKGTLYSKHGKYTQVQVRHTDDNNRWKSITETVVDGYDQSGIGRIVSSRSITYEFMHPSCEVGRISIVTKNGRSTKYKHIHNKLCQSIEEAAADLKKRGKPREDLFSKSRIRKKVFSKGMGYNLSYEDRSKDNLEEIDKVCKTAPSMKGPHGNRGRVQKPSSSSSNTR